MGTETEDIKKEEIQLTQEDATEIQNMLAKKAITKQCQEEISQVLKKFNANLIVDPYSPIGAPIVKIVLNLKN